MREGCLIRRGICGLALGLEHRSDMAGWALSRDFVRGRREGVVGYPPIAPADS